MKLIGISSYEVATKQVPEPSLKSVEEIPDASAPMLEPRNQRW